MAKNTLIVRTPEEHAIHKARKAAYKRAYDEQRKAMFPKEMVRECVQCGKKEKVIVETYGKSKGRHFCSDLCRRQNRVDVREGKKDSTYSPEGYKKRQLQKGKYVKIGIQAHKPKEEKKVYVDPTAKSRRDYEYWEALRAHKGLV